VLPFFAQQVSRSASPGSPGPAPLPELQGAVIVFDGNSISTDIYTGSGNAIPQQVGARPSISSKSVAIFNFAVASQNTRQMAADAVTQIDIRKPAAPAAFIVIPWEIGNDIYSGQTAQQAYENYRDYCLARQAAGAKVIAITVCDRNQSTPGGLNPTQFRAEIAAANALLTANYSSFADALVNSNDVPALADASNFSDGIHPDGTDLQGLAPLIEAAILEITAQALGGE